MELSYLTYMSKAQGLFQIEQILGKMDKDNQSITFSELEVEWHAVWVIDFPWI